MQSAHMEALATEVVALREQSLTHVKERVALKSILDDKVRSLIADVGQSLAELPIEVRACIGSEPGQACVTHAFGQELTDVHISACKHAGFPAMA